LLLELLVLLLLTISLLMLQISCFISKAIIKAYNKGSLKLVNFRKIKIILAVLASLIKAIIHKRL
jgi:hypothetical protein